MKRLLLPLLVTLFALVAVRADAQDSVCWKPSSGRGAGTVPDTCPAGKEKLGLLCYTMCPAGTKRVGVDCHSVCPAGLRDDGLFCRAAEYGRGAGYPWQGGDPGIVWEESWWSGMFARCERDHGRGNCEKNGSIVYPKCAPGYDAAGCCICRPRQPNCAALGLAGAVDLSCAKVVKVGEPSAGTCGGGREFQAGLCYAGCASGSYGVGPVCWGRCPASRPTDCGAMCGTNAGACAAAITEQVVGTLEVIANVALTVATAGASTGAQVGANVAKSAAQASGKTIIKNASAQTVKGLTKAQIKQEIKDIALEAGQAIAEGQLEQLANAAAGLEFDFTSLDPTGISGMIKSFVLPMCK
ncbi:MAG: hypothetical protein ABW252_06755 [Polyangiales bacterium]